MVLDSSTLTEHLRALLPQGLALDRKARRLVCRVLLLDLRRALVLSGARSQVVSLWKVDDKATEALMTAFYTRLTAGEDRVQALRQVQRDMREGRLSQPARSAGSRGRVNLVSTSKSDAVDLSGWRHPFYWASFGLSGADGPVRFE